MPKATKILGFALVAIHAKVMVKTFETRNEAQEFGIRYLRKIYSEHFDKFPEDLNETDFEMLKGRIDSLYGLCDSTETWLICAILSN